MTEAKTEVKKSKSKQSLLASKSKKPESKAAPDKTFEHTTVAFSHFPGLSEEVRRVQIRSDVAGKARGYGKDWCVNNQHLFSDLNFQWLKTTKASLGAKGWLRALKQSIFSNFAGYSERPTGSHNPAHTEMRRAVAYLLSALLLEDPVTAIRLLPILRGYRACGSGISTRIEVWAAKIGCLEVDGQKVVRSPGSFSIRCPDTERLFQVMSRPDKPTDQAVTVLEVTNLDQSLSPVLLACMEDPRARKLVLKNLSRFRAAAGTQYTPPEADDNDDEDDDDMPTEREVPPRSAVERYRTLVGLFDRLDQETPLTGDLRNHAKRVVQAWREMTRNSG